jgi:PHD/YefM family antitoxin component YafN of YafNO toxin-antitoxin module
MVMMTEKSYSIAHTKNHLPVLVHSLETNPSIPITRRGKVVAYLVSTREYESLIGKRKQFTDAWKSLRKSEDFKKYALSDKEVSTWRDSSSGRNFSF